MTIIARPATPGRWVDFSAFPTRAQAQSIRDYGVIGCFTYVPLPGVTDAQKANDITAERLLMLIDLGFEVGLVQHPRFPNWDPRNHSGMIDAAVASEYALDVGYPDGAHLFNDFEGVIITADAPSGKLFLEGWALRILAGGLKAGLYVGYQQPLDAMSLYLLHGINSYWSDAGHRKVATRGVAISQGIETTIDGERVDLDEVAPDKLGGLPFIAASV